MLVLVLVITFILLVSCLVRQWANLGPFCLLCSASTVCPPPLPLLVLALFCLPNRWARLLNLLAHLRVSNRPIQDDDDDDDGANGTKFASYSNFALVFNRLRPCLSLGRVQLIPQFFKIRTRQLFGVNKYCPLDRRPC